MINGELIVDNFAGGGGASTGIELATGYSVDIAINHDPEAIRMHQTNHPNTKHYCRYVMGILWGLLGSLQIVNISAKQKAESPRIRTSVAWPG